ncbi:MAG: carboxy terminal-processing peptidase [Planctomycetota bacterium]
MKELQMKKTRLSQMTTGVCLSLLAVSSLIAQQNTVPPQAGANAVSPPQSSRSGPAADEKLGEVSKNDRQSARWVADLMLREHLSQKPIDDLISGRALEMFIKSLDPAKTYFLKSDIAEFQQWNTKLDDQFKEGDFSAAFEIFKRFLQRVDEGVNMALYWVDQPMDYSVDETLNTDSDKMEFAADEAELRDRWRKRIKYNLLVLKGDESLKDDPREKLRRRYRNFSNRMKQLDNSDVVEMFVTAVTTSFDPHTTYMSKDTFKSFMIQMSLQLEGIGATLSSDDEGYTVIKSIVPKGPADKQGQLKVEDKIVAVGQGEDGEYVDVTGMKLDDVVKMIRGKPNTMVRLSVISGNESKEIRINREKVNLDDQAAQGEVFERGQKADGSPFKVGVINLPSFYSDMDSGDGSKGRSTTTDVDKILQDFRGQAVDAVVLDLRRNGGGSLREAINCTGLFIDYGPVVQVKDPQGQVQQHNDERRGLSWDKPLVVLTSKFSASASEILAGAVQDYGRGLVIGDTTTHGKGTVQSLLDLNQLVFRGQDAPQYFGALKITMQQFYRPSGDSTQKRGVLSDIILPSVTDKMDVSETDLDYPVEFDRVSAAPFKTMGMVTPEIVTDLAGRSRERIEKSPEFGKEIRKIAKYVEFKDAKSVELNEEKFRKQREEFDAEKEDEKQLESTASKTEGIEMTPYLEEVLQITQDYARLLNKG